jgi:hypothetical protein
MTLRRLSDAKAEEAALDLYGPSLNFQKRFKVYCLVNPIAFLAEVISYSRIQQAFGESLVAKS